MNVVKVRDVLPWIDEIEVNGDSWRKSKGGILISNGALTCTVIVAYLPDQKLGYLGHFSSLSNPDYEHAKDARHEFETMVSDIDAHKKESIQLWLGGAVVGSHPEVYKDRQYVEKKIAELDPKDSELRIDWEEEFCGTTVLLDSSDGTLIVDSDYELDFFRD